MAIGTIVTMAARKEELDAFIRRQDAGALADVLLELAEAHPAVQKRLARMQLADKPDRLAATFRKTLAGWRRQNRLLDYRDSQEWGAEAQAWLAQIERELLPRDPMATVELVGSFIECDAKFFDRADDSSGCIGSAMRAACRLWLEAAARCETPSEMWPARLQQLFAGDRYGAREPLLLQANLLLSEAQLWQLVAGYERQVDSAPPVSGPWEASSPDARSAFVALTLLSHALRDPDVHVRATLRRSPRPNSRQKQEFVLQYLDVDRPADALRWLDDEADWHPHTRLRLLAETLRRLGHTDRSAPVQQQVFEQTLSVEDFRGWLGHLAPPEQTGALARARQLALDHDDPVTAARLLVEIECWDDAEQVLVAEQARITGQDYVWLVPLAKSLETQQRWRGATAVYRALLDAILAKAHAPAYGHGARYWHGLNAIAAQAPELMPLQPHDAYIAVIRRKHARKVAFWAQVNKGTTAAADDGGRDDTDDA